MHPHSLEFACCLVALTHFCYKFCNLSFSSLFHTPFDGIAVGYGRGRSEPRKYSLKRSCLAILLDQQHTYWKSWKIFSKLVTDWGVFPGSKGGMLVLEGSHLDSSSYCFPSILSLQPHSLIQFPSALHPGCIFKVSHPFDEEKANMLTLAKLWKRLSTISLLISRTRWEREFT